MKSYFRILALVGCVVVAQVSAFAWGAIAVDDEDGQSADEVGYGYVTGEASEAAAKRGALKECRAKNATCKVVLTFESCGAYAVSGKRWGTGEGSTTGGARRQALANCANEACKVVIAECN